MKNQIFTGFKQNDKNQGVRTNWLKKSAKRFLEQSNLEDDERWLTLQTTLHSDVYGEDFSTSIRYLWRLSATIRGSRNKILSNNILVIRNIIYCTKQINSLTCQLLIALAVILSKLDISDLFMYSYNWAYIWF